MHKKNPFSCKTWWAEDTPKCGLTAGTPVVRGRHCASLQWIQGPPPGPAQVGRPPEKLPPLGPTPRLGFDLVVTEGELLFRWNTWLVIQNVCKYSRGQSHEGNSSSSHSEFNLPAAHMQMKPSVKKQSPSPHYKVCFNITQSSFILPLSLKSQSSLREV